MAIKDERMIVEKIRSSYQSKSKEKTKLEQLKELDRKVKTPAHLFAYIFGIIGTLILGTGLSFAMDVIGNSLVLGIIVGVIGIILMIINYPIYKKLLNSRKQKYSSEILIKSNEILNNQIN